MSRYTHSCRAGGYDTHVPSHPQCEALQQAVPVLRQHTTIGQERMLVVYGMNLLVASKSLAWRTDIHGVIEQCQHCSRRSLVWTRKQRQRRQKHVGAPKLHNGLQELLCLWGVPHPPTQRPNVTATALDLPFFDRALDRSEAGWHAVALVASCSQGGRQIAVPQSPLSLLECPLVNHI